MLLIFKAFFGSYIFPRNNMEFILFILFCIIFIKGFFLWGVGVKLHLCSSRACCSMGPDEKAKLFLVLMSQHSSAGPRCAAIWHHLNESD